VDVALALDHADIHECKRPVVSRFETADLQLFAPHRHVTKNVPVVFEQLGFRSRMRELKTETRGHRSLNRNEIDIRFGTQQERFRRAHFRNPRGFAGVEVPSLNGWGQA